jgi:hypothetical protein
MKKKIELGLVFIVTFCIAFGFLYIIVSPMVQDAYVKGYERGRSECQTKQPIINPFGDFEINVSCQPACNHSQ